MLLEQKKLLNYWRATIKNEQILGIKINNNQYDDYFLPKQALVNNKCIDLNHTKKLFNKYKQFLIKIKKDYINSNDDEVAFNKQQEIMILPIVMAPFVYKKKYEHGWHKSSHKKNYIHPIWIYAYLNQEGELFSEYPCLLPPWIAREYLSPSYKQSGSTIIGDIASYDNFLEQNNINSLYNCDDTAKLPKNISLPQLYNYAKKILQKVAPSLNDCLELDGYIADPIEQILVIPADNNKNKNYSAMLLKLLDSLATENKEFSPLFSRYLSLKPSPINNTILTIEEQLATAAINHLGQMTEYFPLSQSQRVALHHLLLMPEGQILAINGPPGTGKTSLLGSIVASLWVKAALKKEFPPIIVVSSSNNRAIQNVINSLENKIGKATNLNSHSNELLAQRWIKGVTSFGLYLTNNSNGDYQYYSENNQCGTLQEIEKNNYVQIKEYYLNNFNKYFGLNVVSIEKSVELLHDKMLNLAETLRNTLEIATKYMRVLKMHPKYANEHILVNKIQSLKTRLNQLNANIHKLNKCKLAWEIFLAKNLWYQVLAFLLPFLKNLCNSLVTEKIEKFLLSQEITIKPQLKTVTNYLKQQTIHTNSQLKKVIFLIASYENYLKDLCYIKSKWENWQNNHKINNLDLATLFDFNSIEQQKEQNILVFLDTKIRFLLFQYAVHYWEAQWILETLKKTKQIEKYRFDRNSKLNNFKHMAMLAPCFITTMQSGPGFFTFKMTSDQEHEFMLNSIDLLIVDEASQVQPGYGAGMMALAKKACVVGDILQLPPIANMVGSVDIGNMKHYQLIKNNEEYHAISNYGANAASCSKHKAGSVMKLAKNASFFNESLDNSLKEKGLFLTEHRRCVPEIISYCNEYFYGNKINYLRPSNKNRPFPPIGYAHISGFQQEIGTSKINNTEAISIAKWISDKQAIFLKLYPDKKLDQIFGIITPFNTQTNIIKRALEEQGLALATNNVGTIHTFQGGEFPVIIFSPVYSYQPTQKLKNFFFDTEYTMLNVAVSRAMDHFFVFGDMEIFNPTTNTPSGFLANYLFAKPENELTDVKILHQFYKENNNINVNHINSLTEHREILKKAFCVAKNRIIVVSPWITYHAIAADNVELLIKSAISRGAEVIIYTDIDKINSYNNSNTKSLAGIDILEKAGAEIRAVKNIHAKTLLVDNQFFIEGSFNWLSASRTNPNYESSICCEGKNLIYLTNNFIKRLENRKLFLIKKNTEIDLI